MFSRLATFHSFGNARYSDISIYCKDFYAGFLITFRKNQKEMIFGQTMIIIIITIIKHHNSKQYIYSVFIKTVDKRLQGRIQGGGGGPTRRAPPLKLEKIRFFGVKS